MSLFLGLTSLALWPWAMARVAARFDLPVAPQIWWCTGILWAGWWLGIVAVLAPAWGWAANVGWFVFPPFVFLFLGRASEGSITTWVEVPAALWVMIAAVMYLTFMAFLNAVSFPTASHDALIADLMSRHLANDWNFASLPRLAPDEQGFFYPYTHPPAMSAILAWLRLFGGEGWLLRVPSALAAVGVIVCTIAAGRSLGRGAGWLAACLLLGSPLLYQKLTDNSQDVFRLLPLAAALWVMIDQHHPWNLTRAAVLGAFLGLGAAFHPIQFIFVPLFGIAAAHLLRRQRVWVLISVTATAALIGAYPYIWSKFALGSWLGPKAEALANQAPTMLEKWWQARYEREGLGDVASLAATRWRQFSEPGRYGIVPWLGFIAVLQAFFRWRIHGPFGATILAIRALGCIAGGFLLFQVDPGDFLLRASGYGLWGNPRYALSIVPVFALTGGWMLAGLLCRASALRQLVVLLIVGLILMPVRLQANLRAKLPAERGSECFFCSDEEKLTRAVATATHEGARLAERMGRHRCIAFDEAEYFAWSRLPGLPYYDPVVEHLVGNSDPTSARRLLDEEGIDCILARSKHVKSALWNDTIFGALSRDDHVWVAEVKDGFLLLPFESALRPVEEISLSAQWQTPRQTVVRTELPLNGLVRLSLERRALHFEWVTIAAQGNGYLRRIAKKRMTRSLDVSFIATGERVLYLRCEAACRFDAKIFRYAMEAR